MAPRENENNAYAKFWGDKQRALWYVMVFSGVVNCVVLLFVMLGLGRIIVFFVTSLETCYSLGISCTSPTWAFVAPIFSFIY